MATPPMPPGIDLGESRASEIVVALSITWTFAAVAVILRFLARRVQANKIGLEDWLILLSLVAAGVHVFTSIGYMIPNGTGKHLWAAPASATRSWALGLFVSEMAYTATLSAAKWSTLALYWRIFSARKSIRLLIWSLSGVVTAWCVAVALVTLFQCFPVRAFWERYDPISPMSPDEFTCGVDVKAFFKGNSIPNIITDALVIVLPIPYILTLQLRNAQKFALAGIFALGTFVTVVSMLRLHVILSVDLLSPDITWNFIDTIIWTNVEANTAIICACLPTLKPLLNLVLKGKFKSTAGASAQNSGGHFMLSDRLKSNPVNSSSYSGGASAGPVAIRKGHSGGSSDDERPFARLSDQELSMGNGEGTGSREHLADGTRKGGILVTKEFDMKHDSQ